MCVGDGENENEGGEGAVVQPATTKYTPTHMHTRSSGNQAQATYYSGLNPKHLDISLSIQTTCYTQTTC